MSLGRCRRYHFDIACCTFVSVMSRDQRGELRAACTRAGWGARAKSCRARLVHRCMHTIMFEVRDVFVFFCVFFRVLLCFVLFCCVFLCVFVFFCVFSR